MRRVDYSKIFNNKSASVFDNMDKVIRLIKEAEGDEEQTDEEGGGEDGGEEAPPTDGGDGGMPPEEDPTMAPEGGMGQEGEPADEGDGIYVSSNEKATLAKTMLDALQASPPKPGEIPENLLNVTNTNADDVIKYIQSLVSLSNATSLEDNGDTSGLVDTLKEV